jgi:hypothetical protein
VVRPQNHWDDFLWFDLKIGGDGFLWFGLKTGSFRFPGLGFKTGSYSLVIWASKSPRRFLDLGLKIKQVLVCRLHHKIDRWRMARGHTSRSGGLLHLEASHARVSQSDLKTGGGTTVGGARDTIV